MRAWVKVALVTALFAVPAMALGQVIWPPDPGSPEPSAGQLPYFILLSVFEAAAFGLGISFLLFVPQTHWGLLPSRSPEATREKSLLVPTLPCAPTQKHLRRSERFAVPGHSSNSAGALGHVLVGKQRHPPQKMM